MDWSSGKPRPKQTPLHDAHLNVHALPLAKVYSYYITFTDPFWPLK